VIEITAAQHGWQVPCRHGAVFVETWPKLWRERAEATRALADQMEDQGTKEALLHLAADYERRATEAEARRE
jgi:hypothetical protein